MSHTSHHIYHVRGGGVKKHHLTDIICEQHLTTKRSFLFDEALRQLLMVKYFVDFPCSTNLLEIHLSFLILLNVIIILGKIVFSSGIPFLEEEIS